VLGLVGSGIGVGPASASCAAGVEYQGRFYLAWSAGLPVAKGRLLGDAVYPACDDTGGCGGDDPDAAGRPTQVWAMDGVDPTQVVVGRTQGSHRFVVYGRPDADPRDYFRFAGGNWHPRQDPPPGR
jgi:hypothetical protein